MIADLQKVAHGGLTRSVLVAVAVALASVFGSNAGALSLTDAFVSAYQNNPSLQAERANTRKTNEGLRERVGLALPQVTATARTSYSDTYAYTPGAWTSSFPASVGVGVTQILYGGGSVELGLQMDRIGAQAQWAGLRAVESSILSSVAQSYIAIAKQEALQSQLAGAVRVQESQVAAAQARFDLGEGTLTDIAQARSRRAVVQASATQASNGAATARASLRQLIARDVGAVQVPNFPFALPNSEQAAIEAAMAFDATIAARRFQLELARLQVEFVKTEGRPSVNAEAGLNHNVGDVRNLLNSQSAGITTTWSVGLNARVPLYQGGQVQSKIRQAQFAIDQAHGNLEAARAAARSAVSSAWNDMRNARALAGSYAAQREAAALALEGAQAELEVGTKTVLDVLTAQQTLQEANVGLVNAKYDEVAAAYRLYAATGRLTARDLSLPVTPFDAEADYERVRQILDRVAPFIPELRFSDY